MVALQEVSFQFYFLVKKFGKGISSCTTYVCGKERFNYVLYTLTHKISKNGICIRKITQKVFVLKS